MFFLIQKLCAKELLNNVVYDEESIKHLALEDLLIKLCGQRLFVA
jgi:hypothetical protein